MSLSIKGLSSYPPPVFNGREYPVEIPLDEIDPYSLEKFKDILESRKEMQLECYLGVIEEEGRPFFVEGSRFIEQIFRKNLRNPLTNKSLVIYYFLVYSEQTSSFEYYCDASQIEEPLFYFPIWMSDHTRSSEERLDHCYNRGRVYLIPPNKNLEKALHYLEQAASGGLKKAQKTLARVHFENGEKEKWIFWFKEYLKGIDPSPKELMFLAIRILKENLGEAIELFERAALMGNLLAIINLIEIYERLKDESSATKWREKLPKEWQSSSIEKLLQHFKEINTTDRQDIKSDLVKEGTKIVADF